MNRFKKSLFLLLLLIYPSTAIAQTLIEEQLQSLISRSNNTNTQYSERKSANNNSSLSLFGEDTRSMPTPNPEINEESKLKREEGTQPNAKQQIVKQIKRQSLIERIFTTDKTALEYDPYVPTSNPSENADEVVYVEQELEQFGYSIFNSGPINLSSEALSMDPSYVLGPGDKLSITFWGSLDSSAALDIKKDGTINLPGVGPISLAGVTLADADDVIRQQVEKKYVNFELSVTLLYLRSVNVFILGDARVPGNYRLPANASVLHALYAAGGPTKVGSMRNIKIIRNSKTIAHFDLYEFLLKGKSSQDIQLQAEDTVFVEPIGKLVRTDGEVKRPGIYEIKAGETINDLLGFAGGIGITAVQHKVQLDRIVAGKKRTVVDISTDGKAIGKSALSSVKVQDGDSITVYPILERIHNYVVIRGQVERPGRYSYRSDMTIKDLIDVADGLKPGAYLNRVELFRYFTDEQREIISVDISDEAGMNTALSEWDIITINSHNQIFGEPMVRVHGAVRNEGDFKLLKNMYVSDLVFLAQLKRYANTRIVEIERKAEGRRPALIRLDLHDMLENPHTEADILLQDGDNVFVRMDSETLKERYITLKGEVKYPGKYMAREGETLSDVIARAGGYTPNAFLHGAILTRESAKYNEKIGQNKVLDDEKKRFVYDQSHLSGIGQDSQTAYQVVLASRREALRMLEERLEENNGRIILDLASKKNSDAENPNNIVIENGDQLIVPSKPQAVTLIGGVQSSTSIVYKEDLKATDYISRVGGYTPYADKGKVYIFKPNGEVASHGHVIEPGDIIYVPEEVKISVNWLQFFTNITSIISNAVTTITLVERL